MDTWELLNDNVKQALLGLLGDLEAIVVCSAPGTIGVIGDIDLNQLNCLRIYAGKTPINGGGQ